MKRIVMFTLVTSMILSCFACSKDGYGANSTSDHTPTNPSVTTEIKDGLTYSKNTYAKLFNNPSAEYRWNAINHSLSSLIENIGIASFTVDHVQRQIRYYQIIFKSRPLTSRRDLFN